MIGRDNTQQILLKSASGMWKTLGGSVVEKLKEFWVFSNGQLNQKCPFRKLYWNKLAVSVFKRPLKAFEYLITDIAGKKKLIGIVGQTVQDVTLRFLDLWPQLSECLVPFSPYARDCPKWELLFLVSL